MAGQGATTRRDALMLGGSALVGTVVARSAKAAAPSPAANTRLGRITALNIYVLFAHPTTLTAMEHHYGTVLGLPLYRRWRIAPGELQSKDNFWLGETILLDLSYQGVVLGERARQVPILRVDDVDAAVAAIRARDVRVTNPVVGGRGREAFVSDPMGQQFGLRETPSDSSFAADREARRRAARGEAFNPGCASMPPGWRELGWVQLRAADPSRLAAFYHETLGLPLIDHRGGSILLDLGDAITLEIVGGGIARPAPAAQYASTAATILRVHGLPALAMRLKEAGVSQVGRRYDMPAGSWFYVADPEGNVVGLSESNHPSLYATKITPSPIYLEAARRAVEANSGRQHDLS